MITVTRWVDEKTTNLEDIEKLLDSPHFKYGSGNYRCNLPDVRPGKERQRGRNDGFASDDRRHADRCVDDVRGWCAEGGLLVSDPVL